jgi:hypothetical protein
VAEALGTATAHLAICQGFILARQLAAFDCINRYTERIALGLNTWSAPYHPG